MKWQDIILIILAILSLIMGAWYLFGNSPTFEQTILSFMLVTLIGAIVKLSTIDARLKFLERRFNKFENSFIKLADDFKELYYEIKNQNKKR